MTTELPQSGPELEILLQGLRAYSDNCEPPYLTPGCPFALDLRDGTRGCGEECIDLIAQLGAPAGVEEMALGEGTGLRVRRRRRPRARRGPDKNSRPFDAAEVYFDDTAKRDIELWSPVSLLYELRQAMGTPPPDDDIEAKERRATILRLIEILEERGIEFERFLRPAFAGAQGLLLGVVAVMGSSMSVGGRFAEIGDQWRSILGLVELPEDSHEAVAGVIAECIPRTVEWAMSASVDELVEWWPTDGNVPDGDTRVLRRLTESDDWITDRFLATYLDHWSTASLHAEWEWIHGRRESPIPASAMRARKVDPVQLSYHIADLAAVDKSSRAGPVAMGQYQSLAGRLLKEGRREAAAGVFEGALAVEPDDPEAHNNRGFCLLVDDPEHALASLDRAAQLGYEPSPINAANRVLCLARLGRLAAANDLADTWFLQTANGDAIAARMWDPLSLDSDPKIIEVADISFYLAQLGIHIAQRAGDERLTAIWAARVEAAANEASDAETT